MTKKSVIWNPNKKMEAMQERMIEIEVANPFKMLSAYLPHEYQ
jgi:hypothetical protein